MTDPRPVPGIWHFLGTMPSTNVRIAATILLMLATGVRVFVGWEPSWEWLSFLLLSAGLDIAQFANKRSTSTEFVVATKPLPMTSTSTLTQPDGTVSETVTTLQDRPPDQKPQEIGA